MLFQIKSYLKFFGNLKMSMLFILLCIYFDNQMLLWQEEQAWICSFKDYKNTLYKIETQ
jgi:hypothetical protein